MIDLLSNPFISPDLAFTPLDPNLKSSDSYLYESEKDDPLDFSQLFPGVPFNPDSKPSLDFDSVKDTQASAANPESVLSSSPSLATSNRISDLRKRAFDSRDNSPQIDESLLHANKKRKISSSKETPIKPNRRLKWTPKYENALFNKILPLFIKKGKQIKRETWVKISQRMNEKFKTDIFTPEKCHSKWNNKTHAQPKKTIPKENRRFSIKWTPELTDAFYEITNKYLIRKQHNVIIEEQSWEKIAQEMNERFSTDLFTKTNCFSKWRHQYRDKKVISD